MNRDAQVVTPAQRRAVWPETFSAIAGVLSVIVGVVVLGAWWFGLARIVRPIAGSPAMVPNTALCFVLLGASLLLLRRPHVSSSRRWIRSEERRVGKVRRLPAPPH